MKKAAFIVSALPIVSPHALPSAPYETRGFKNGGSIKGTVEFVGDAIPRDKTFTCRGSQMQGAAASRSSLFYDAENQANQSIICKENYRSSIFMTMSRDDV